MLDLIALGERAIKKVKDALAGGGLSAEPRARLEYILPRLLVLTLARDPEWEGPQDAGQWNFAFFVYASVPDICDIHFMVGYPPGGGDPQAGYDPANADIQLIGFPDGWSASYDKDTGEIVVECGGFEGIPLDAGSDYEIKISTPTMGKKDPKPVGWHYTDSDGHKIGAPETKGTLNKGPRF